MLNFPELPLCGLKIPNSDVQSIRWKVDSWTSYKGILSFYGNGIFVTIFRKAWFS
jgi:hypothetical protein